MEMKQRWQIRFTVLAVMIIGMGIVLTAAAWAQETGEERKPVSGEAYPAIFEATRHAVLSAERAGVLSRLAYEAGSAVKKGEIIAQVETGELALQKKRAQLSLKHLSVKLNNLDRLSRKGLATTEEVAEARMQRDVIRTDIDIIKRQIANSYIRSPYPCVVVRRHMQPHEWVTAGQPVVEVVDPSELRAVANIPSASAVRLKKGDEHDFYVHDLDMTVTGDVQAVVPMVDELSNTTQVIWRVKETGDALLSGMKGEVLIDR
jgi:RND family efflux transporter MFP subunit